MKRLLFAGFLVAVAAATTWFVLDPRGTSNSTPTTSSNATPSADPNLTFPAEAPDLDDDAARRLASDEGPAADSVPLVPDEPKPVSRDGVVRGRLIGAATRQGISGARVLGESENGETVTTLTNRDGSFRIGPLPPGNATLGFQFVDTHLTLDRFAVYLGEGGDIDLGPLLVIWTPQCSGRVVDANSAAPIVDAVVVATHASDVDRNVETTTTDDGTFLLIGLGEPGEWILTANSDDHATRPPYQRVLIDGEDRRGETIVVHRTDAISGRVFGPDHRGVHANIEILGGGERYCCVETADDGTFRVEDALGIVGLAEADDRTPLYVRATSEPFLPAISAMTVDEVKRSVPIEMNLTSGGSIRGRAVSATGEPISSLTIGAYPALGDAVGGYLWTDTATDGHFEFEGLIDGTFVVGPAALHERLAPTSRVESVDVRAGSPPALVEIVFQAAGAIGGVAVDRRTRIPLVERLVTLSHPDWLYPIGTLTDGNGLFRFSAVTPGEYDVSLRGVSWEDPRPPVVIPNVNAGTETLRFEVDEEIEDGTIEIRLSDAQSGAPIVAAIDVTMRYFRFDQPLIDEFTITPDANGTVLLDGLPWLEFRIELRVEGYARYALTTTITEQERTEQRLALLDLPVTLRGIVRDFQGRGIAGARVETFSTYDPGLLQPGVGTGTNEVGEFTLYNVSPTDSVVAASAPGYAATAIEIAPGTRVLVDPLRLNAGAPVVGTLRFGDGSAAPLTPLTLVGAIATVRTTTDLEGRFAFEHVEDGTFELRDDRGLLLGSGELVDHQGLVVELEL